MSTRTLVQLNHDLSDRMDSESFLVALGAFLRNPNNTNAENLSQYGVMVYGTCHHEEVRTRGFHCPAKGSDYPARWFRVLAREAPFQAEI